MMIIITIHMNNNQEAFVEGLEPAQRAEVLRLVELQKRDPRPQLYRFSKQVFLV